MRLETIQDIERPEYFYLGNKDVKYQFKTYACLLVYYSDTATVEKKFEVIYVH